MVHILPYRHQSDVRIGANSFPILESLFFYVLINQKSNDYVNSRHRFLGLALCDRLDSVRDLQVLPTRLAVS